MPLRPRAAEANDRAKREYPGHSILQAFTLVKRRLSGVVLACRGLALGWRAWMAAGRLGTVVALSASGFGFGT